MLKPFARYSRRTSIILLETLAVVTLLAGLALGVFLWRISQGPMSIGFAKEYVEEALSDEDEQVTVTFDDMVFSWPEFQGPFLLDLSGLRVQKGAGESNVLTIKEASVGLSRGALLFGRIRPKTVIIKSPELELVRTEGGHLSLFYNRQEVKAASASEEPDQKRKNPGAEVAEIFKDMAHHRRGSFLSRLDAFEIRGASVAVRDHQFGLSWYATGLDFVIQEEDGGVSASVNVPLPGGQKENANIAFAMVYRTKSDDFRAMASIRDVNPYIISRFLPVPDVMSGQNLYFTGDLEAAFDTNLIPTAAKFSGAIPNGEINVPEEFDAPIPISNVAIASTYDGADQKLSLSNLSGEIGGIAFHGAGEAVQSENVISIPITLNVDAAQLAQVPPLFPKAERDGQAYAWLAHKIQGGNFTDVALAMELTATKTRDQEKSRDEWNVTMPKMALDFAFTGAKVQYHDTLMPAEDASGKGRLDLAAEVIEIIDGAGKIAGMDASGISVKVTDLMTAGAGYVSVNGKIKGPMASALEYIAAPPINMNKERIGLDAAKVKGMIEAEVSVNLPTVHDVPKDEVKVDVSGTMSELELPAVVSNVTLTGGPLKLATEDGGFRVTGDAKLDGQDVAMEWHQYYDSAGRDYSMQIKAQAQADSNLRQKFGVNLEEYITGTMPVDVVYTRQANGDALIDVKGDLNPVRLWISPFKFEKPAGTPGALSLQAHLLKDILTELSDVELKSKDLSVTKARIGFAPRGEKKADLDTGSLPDAIIGKTKANLSFEVDKTGAMAIKAESSVFDLAPFLQETEASNLNVEAEQQKEKRQPLKISLKAAKMLAKNDQVALGTKSYMETDADGDITRLEYDAAIGKGKLMVRFRPDEKGQRTFRLQTDDAGGVLYALGLYENVLGGTLLIYGEPKGGDLRGNLYGSMRMENFRVVKAPALASLLSLMSLSGVGQLLRNQGLVFSKLESDFEWRFRPAGNLLIIKEGKTSGNSIGLTFSGVIDRGAKTTDISGTIIPITSVNTLLSKIPLVGDILGGASGLIAATYSMKGPTSEPRVSVNPLSVLAPGIIRRILFEGGYESKIPDDPEAPKASPESQVKSDQTGAKTKSRPVAALPWKKANN